MSTITTAFPSPSKNPTPTLTAIYHNGPTSSTLTFNYPLLTTPSPPPSSSSAPPPLPLEAKTAYLKKLRELCMQLQGDLNEVLTEMMREKDMDLDLEQQEQEEEEGEEEKV